MKVAVIGGGPAGMMAALTASQNGAQVTLFEKNEKLGKKLYISGKGRCNLTNNCTARELLDNVVNNSKFLYGAINRFSPQNAIDFCENNGLSLKTERGNRVFPASDKSSDVIRFFAKQLDNSGVNVRLNTEITAIQCQENGILLNTIYDIVLFDAVIVATGGVSYVATGSTGDGYKFAEKLGHNVTALRPALCKILCEGTANLQGLSLKNVTVSAIADNGKTVASQFGEMLFTDDGVSGPAVLTLSSMINKYPRNALGYISIDLKPALDCDKLDSRILRDFSQNNNKNFINSLNLLLPERLIKTVALQSGISFVKKVNSVTAVERAKLVQTIKNLRFKFNSLDKVDYGIVTSGGVDIKQINPSTMESKLVRNVYFAGEVLDVDALTGGFNIQIALSTGYVAGLAASQNKE